MTIADEAGPEAERLVGIGVITKPHGLKGEVRLRLYNLDSTVVFGLRRARLRHADGTVAPVRITAARPGPGAVLMKLQGVNDRAAAETLAKAELLVPRALLGEADEADGEYFACDLEGCEVVFGVEPIGRVRTVVSYPTCDALVVDRPDARPLEIPMHAQYIQVVDVPGKKIVLASVEDLE